MLNADLCQAYWHGAWGAHLAFVAVKSQSISTRLQRLTGKEGPTGFDLVWIFARAVDSAWLPWIYAVDPLVPIWISRQQHWDAAAKGFEKTFKCPLLSIVWAIGK